MRHTMPAVMVALLAFAMAMVVALSSPAASVPSQRHTAAIVARTPSTATCAKGSPVVDEPFCNTSLSFASRAALLTAAMTQSEKLAMWQGHGLQPGVDRLNVKPYVRLICPLQKSLIMLSPQLHALPPRSFNIMSYKTVVGNTMLLSCATPWQPVALSRPHHSCQTRHTSPTFPPNVVPVQIPS